MTVRDPNAWTHGVQFAQIRDRIIYYLLDLMDTAYQEREWLEEGKETSFYHYFSYAVELFEDLNLYDDVDEEKMPYKEIGLSLKSKSEAEALYKVVYWTNKLLEVERVNKSYLASPFLTPLREASAKAFEVFMENERDNKEFCKFITELQNKRKQFSKKGEVGDGQQKV